MGSKRRKFLATVLIPKKPDEKRKVLILSDLTLKQIKKDEKDRFRDRLIDVVLLP